MKKRINALLGQIVLFGALNGPAQALDVQPFDVLPAPSGTAAWTTSLYTAANRTTYFDGEEVGGNLRSSFVGQRLTYFFDILGQPAMVTGVIPYLDLRDGNIAGSALNDTSGMGDTTLAATYWLYSQQETRRHLNISAYVGIPTGEYEHGNSLNPGNNRAFYTLQLGGSYGLGSRWLVESALDVSFYHDNKDVGDAHSVLEQKPTYAAQLWVSYAATPTLSFSAGWGGSWGGDQKLNGISNGFDSDRQQVRAAVSMWVSPTLHVLGQINKDFAVNGGFEANPSFLLRFTKLF